MSKEHEALKLALNAAYLAGFNASGEGYNGEYPFGDKNQNPEADAVWVRDRDNAIEEALAHAPEVREPPCKTGSQCTSKCQQCHEPEQQDMPKIGCVNHDCDKCKTQQQEPVAHCEAGPEYCPVCHKELNPEPAIYPDEAYEMGLEEVAFIHPHQQASRGWG